jgi:hypothetical protein
MIDELEQRVPIRAAALDAALHRHARGCGRVLDRLEWRGDSRAGAASSGMRSGTGTR